MEPNEVSEFTKQMKEGGESHLRGVSIIISVLAVFVAMVTVLGHRSHTEAVLMESRVADQWNEYQAKKIRQGQIHSEVRLLSMLPTQNEAAAAKQIEEDKKHIEKWDDDLKEEQDKAKEFEDEVRRSERQASRYDLGEALLQIAVVLSSITLLTRQRLYVGLGVLMGVAGLFVAASAFLVH